MQITVLGTANAWGVNELAGTPWPLTGVLSSGRQVPFRKYRTALLVVGVDGTRVLVDCGPDLSHQRREFAIGVLSAILLTHPHFDHIGGLDELNVYRRAGTGLSIPLHAHPQCWEIVEQGRGFGYLQHPLRLVDVRPIRLGESFSVGGLRITPFGVEHSVRAPGSVGFVFEDLASEGIQRAIYTGDFWAVSDPTSPLFAEPTDVLICECDRWAGLTGSAVGGGHMSFEEIVRMLQNGVFSRPQPRRLVLTHFGDHGPCGLASTYNDWRREGLARLTAAGLQAVAPDDDGLIAYDGMVLTMS